MRTITVIRAARTTGRVVPEGCDELKYGLFDDVLDVRVAHDADDGQQGAFVENSRRHWPSGSRCCQYVRAAVSFTTSTGGPSRSASVKNRPRVRRLPVAAKKLGVAAFH